MVDQHMSLMKKEQIHRILDIDSDTQIQNAVTSLIDHSSLDENNSDMVKEQYYELTSCRPRKRNLSVGSENSIESQTLFGNNKDEVIYIDIQPDDSLVKLALKYACTVAELKNANKIYNDVELHAKNVIKIPVFKHGEVYDTYTKLMAEKEKEENKDLQPHSSFDDLDSKYKFRVQKEFSIKNELDYMTSEDDDENIFDITNARDDERLNLLQENERTHRHIHLGQPIDASDEPFQQFIDRMDVELERKIIEAESKKGNLEEVVSAMTTPVIFAPGAKEKPEEFGSVCTYGWKSVVCFLCFIAVLIPMAYLIYFYYHKKDDKVEH